MQKKIALCNLLFMLFTFSLPDQGAGRSAFHEKFFYIDIKRKAADKREKLQSLPVFFRSVLEGIGSSAVHFSNILSQLVDPGFLQAADFFIHRSDVKSFPLWKYFSVRGFSRVSISRIERIFLK